jgi:beta-aspartyl-peptidase (threonine type)
MLVGDGAARFAAEIRAEKATLLTPSTRRLWVEKLAKARETPAGVRRRAKLAPIVAKIVGEERGTVNFIALDRQGDIASAVSTSGWAYKYPGRLGDSPIVGACCTGFGELAIRNVTAKTAVDRLASGISAAEVAERAIADANALDDAAFNIVVLAADGSHAAASNRDRRYAWMTTAMNEPVTAARTLVSRMATV